LNPMPRLAECGFWSRGNTLHLTILTAADISMGGERL
jgi:hypothetical protein